MLIFVSKTFLLYKNFKFQEPQKELVSSAFFVKRSMQVQHLWKWTSAGFEPVSFTWKHRVLTIYTKRF